MTETAVERVLEAMERVGARPRQSGDSWTFFCPVHGDGKSPAGTLSAGRERALIRCNAGCATEDIVTALGLSMSDLFDSTSDTSGKWDELASYVYAHDGRPIARKRKWRMPDGTITRSWDRHEGGTWVRGGLNGRDPGLYRFDELAATPPGTDVFVCEGESDAEAVRSLGEVATTGPHGAGSGKWKPEYTAALASHAGRVILCRDRDEVGELYASEVYGQLVVAGCSVTLVEPIEGKDVQDHLSAGHTLDELAVVTMSTPTVALSTNGHHPPPPPDGAPRLDSHIVEGHLLGQLAQVVSDSTGISLSAPWATICSLVGTWIGRAPVVMVAGEHHCHDYSALVARSGTGKGYSWWATKKLLAPVLGEWLNDRVAEGVNSSEALIDRLAEEGDTRLLLHEEEFSRLVTVNNRGGTTISQVLRELWDSPPAIKTVARVKMAVAHTPHVGFVVHVTPADLASSVQNADLRNGVAGRILWTWVMEERFQPFGPDSGWEQGHNTLLAALAEVGAQARTSGPMQLTPEARELWASESLRLREAAAAHPDPIDALLVRGSSHVMRTALLMAVTDHRRPAPRRHIDTEHLRMAMAWWEQFQAPSTLYVWGQDGVVNGTREDQAEREADTPERSNFQRRAERVRAAAARAGAAGLNQKGQKAALSNRASGMELRDIRDYLVKKGAGRIEQRPTPGGGPMAEVLICE